jgi:MFS family permease
MTVHGSTPPDRGPAATGIRPPPGVQEAPAGGPVLGRGPGRTAAAPGAWTALTVLLVINVFNYIDRQVLSAVIPKLQLDGTLFDPADPRLLTKIGWLTPAFMVAYMLLSPVFGWAAEFIPRWWLVGFGVILWSLASGCSGLAGSFLALLLTRCLVGVGEAAYGPIAPDMISDLFPVRSRGKVMAVFYAAIPVGSALGFVIGGQVAEHFGWRHAFQVTFVGLLLGAVCFFLREPARQKAPPAAERPGYRAVLRELCGIRSFVFLCAGMTATTFLLGGVAVWVPAYVFQREARFVLTEDVLKQFETDNRFLTLQGQRVVPEDVVAKLRPAADGRVVPFAEFRAVLAQRLTKEEAKQYGDKIYDAATAPESMTTGRIGLIFGAITVVSGLVATLLGGAFGDWLRNRGVRGAYFHAAGWTTLLAWPFFVAMLYVAFPWAWVVLFVAVFFLFFNTGPANTILANISRPAIRATAFAINILIIHSLGDAISPLIIGRIADVSSLHTAFLIVSPFILLGGGLWVAGARYLDADTRRAS